MNYYRSGRALRNVFMENGAYIGQDSRGNVCSLMVGKDPKGLGC